jgi:hypothetical protein
LGFSSILKSSCHLCIKDRRVVQAGELAPRDYDTADKYLSLLWGSFWLQFLLSSFLSVCSHRWMKKLFFVLVTLLGALLVVFLSDAVFITWYLLEDKMVRFCQL